jgi:cytoskeletal protein CcmA (bactofilin family)
MFLLIKHICALLGRLTALRRLFADKSTTSSRHNFIGPNVMILGGLQSADDVYLLGKVEGKVECSRLITSNEARMDEIVSTTDMKLFKDNA